MAAPQPKERLNAVPAAQAPDERQVMSAGAEALQVLQRMVPPAMQGQWRSGIDYHHEAGLRAARRGDAAAASASMRELARLKKEIEQTWRR